MDQFYTIDRTADAEFKDRGSKFIAFAHPLVETSHFKFILQQIKKEHPKAVHHCFAYRIGLQGNNFRVSDDGEPSGTAGKVILGQIDSKNLTNTAIIVVRYFGGTLLGIPGLINAYKTVSSLVLQTIPIIQKQVEVSYILHFEFIHINEIMKLVRQYNCTITEQELLLFPFIKINIPLNRLEEMSSRMKDLKNVEFKKVSG
ncbi:MAG: YigZ family protein [Ferruginibacter sp.]